MGIANLTRYFRHLLDRVPGASDFLTDRPTCPISAIAIDLGYLLYRSVNAVVKKDLTDQAIELEQLVIDQCILELDRLLESVILDHPLLAIHLVLDGIPPLNKIRSHLNRTTAQLIQRGCERSIMGWWDECMDHSDHPVMLHNRDIPIYPGSPIVLALEARLQEWCQIRSSDSIVASYSSSADPGEGEIKIAIWSQQWFRDHPDTDLLVIGVDTDLLLFPIANGENRSHVLLQSPREPDCCYHLSALMDLLYQHYHDQNRSTLTPKQFACGLIWSIHLLGNEILPPVIQPYQIELGDLLARYCEASESSEVAIIDWIDDEICIDQDGLAEFYRLLEASCQPATNGRSRRLLVLPEDAHQEIVDMKGCKNLWRDVVSRSKYQSDLGDCSRYLCQMITSLHQIIVPNGSVLLDWYPQPPVIRIANLIHTLEMNLSPPDQDLCALDVPGICRYVTSAPRLETGTSVISTDLLAALLLSDPKKILDLSIRPFLPQSIADRVVLELAHCKLAHQRSQWSTPHSMLQIGPLPTIDACIIHQLLISRPTSDL